MGAAGLPAEGATVTECVLPPDSRHRALHPALATALAFLFGPLAAEAGLVFREVQVTTQGSAPAVRLVRQVSAEGENCRILYEESGDALLPAGSYVLATAHDAFIVDPARSTIAPVDPTLMVPASDAAEPQAVEVGGVSLEQLYEGPGRALLGLDTRHYIFRLRYDVLSPGDAGAPGVVHHEEHHEFFAAPWTSVLQPPAVWRKWRIAEDAGLGADRREVREAMETLHQHGFMLLHQIERRVTGPTPNAADNEHVSREVTALSRETVDAGVFRRPDGLAPAEVLAPTPEFPEDAAPAEPPGGAQPAADGAGSGKR